MSASVFSLKEAVFKAFFIFVLNAAISLQPLAYTLEPNSDMTSTDAIILKQLFATARKKE
jgi:phosphopantetheinyl transferase (holo-ACP synthase)